MKDVFDAEVTKELIRRIRALPPDTRPRWGRMDGEAFHGGA